ncbi:MAG TPA: permease-like cell division protein FtsX [Chitinispirillaceae bacterium]|nr:permease-like cell division protein FtsX [Chitinispirillaceae bacterium]
MRLLFYFFKEAIRGFYQAKLMTVASIVSIAAALFFMSLIAFALINVEHLIGKASEQADLAVYLKDDLADDSAATAELIQQIEQMTQVQKVIAISKDTAWERFSDLYGDEILESVDDNPLPASLELYLLNQYQSAEEVSMLQQNIKSLSGIESVRYSREWIDLVQRFRFYFGLVVTAIVAIMLIVLYFLVSNTIKLTIYARNELVRNMHLVGATRLFINMPFIMEGMLQGLAGAIICVTALLLAKGSLAQLPVIWENETFSLIKIITGIFSIGVFFGWFGSISAVRKFLV